MRTFFKSCEWCTWSVFALVGFSATATVLGAPDDRLGQPLQDVTLRNLKGKEAKLLDMHDAKVLVICYTGLGCPISGRYAPRLEELSKKYTAKGVRFVGINANPQDSLKAIAKSISELGLSFPVLQDMNQELTRHLDAKTSTEVFVVDKEKIIRYRGMIDDQYALGESKATPKARYLERAIEAVLRGAKPLVNRTAAPGCLITRTATSAAKDKAKKPKEKFNYSAHVARIIEENCVSCHRPGQIAPFPLTSYEKVSGWSAMIEWVLQDDRMPPWNASAESDGVFGNQRKLSKKDRGILLAWLKDGMPRGNPAEDPAPKKWPKRWRIGQPDKVFQMKESFLVPKDGVVPYKYFNIPTDFKEDKWITAMEARPGSPDVVHHVLAFIVDSKGKPVNQSRLGLEDGFLCATVPGDTPSIYPKGCAKKLPAGATIVLQMHYTTSGKATRDMSSLGVRFAKEPIQHEVRTRGIYNLSFTIPPGDANYEVKSEFTADQDIEILSLFPHMHTRGKDWAYNLTLPDKTTKKMLMVPKYDFNWQESYIYKQPLMLPKGSKVECVAHFDNSDRNYDNPDPKSAVKWGEQTWDEMMIGYIDWIPTRPEGKRESMSTSVVDGR